MDFNTLAKLRRYLAIKHHLPGRIRVKFNPAIANEPSARKLMNSDASVPPGVHAVRLNTMARSVVIEYDAERIPPELLEDMIDAQDDARAEELLRKLDDILRTASTQEVQ